MIELRVDPEFRDKIPPLTEAEYDQLRENILEDGEVYEPIVVWNGVIVDGHNRWKIICENRAKLEGKFRIKEMNFPDKWAAFEWMYKKQLGRRNLTDEQRTMLIGKMYESRKKSHGASDGFRGNQLVSHQNDDLPNNRKSAKTAREIARDLGIGSATVERAEKFSKGLDALSGVSKEASDKVLQGKTGISKKTVMDIPKMKPEQRKEVAEAIIQGTIKEYQKKPVTPQKTDRLEHKQERPKASQKAEAPASKYTGGGTKEYREQQNLIAEISAEMYDTSKPIEYTVDDLLEEIIGNAKLYVKMLRNTIVDHERLISEESALLVSDAIQRHVIETVNKMMEELLYHGANEGT